MGSRMFPFITKTWNPIAGGPCPYNCYGGGCWATMLKAKYGWEKYKGTFRIHEPAMKDKFKPDDFVFVCDMTDIGNPRIPRSTLIDVFEHIAFFKDTDFLLLTKNPYWHIVWINHLPENVYLGATIETNLDHTLAVSHAPSTTHRLNVMEALKVSYPDRPRFISIEPIMKFDYQFLDLIIRAAPWGVAVGYDGYNNHLPEPKLEDTEKLIECIEEAGIQVFRKDMRRAWDESIR